MQVASELNDRLGGALEESLIDTLVTKCESLKAERDRYVGALDDLKMHGTLIMENWVSVPICEWEQAFKSIGWDA